MATSVLSELTPDKTTITLSDRVPTEVRLEFSAVSDPYSSTAAVDYSLDQEIDVWFLEGNERKKSVVEKTTIEAGRTNVERTVKLVRGPGKKTDTVRVTAHLLTPGENRDPREMSCGIRIVE